MAVFDFSYISAAAPPAADGTHQHRTVRGRTVLPDTGSPPYPVVLVAHGYTSFMDWGFFPELSRRLAAAGIASVRFNFSGSGIGPDRCTMTEPDTFRRNSYLHELADLEELRTRVDDGTLGPLDAARCALLGHSRGGAMGLVHAAEHGGYATVVTWAGMDRILQFTPERLAQWRRQGHLDVMHWTARRRLPLDVATLDAAEAHAARLDIHAACRRLRCPLLVVMGDADRSLPFSVAENLVAAAPDARLLTVAGGDHTFGARHPLQDPVPATLALALEGTAGHLAGLLQP